MSLVECYYEKIPSQFGCFNKKVSVVHGRRRHFDDTIRIASLA